MTRRGVSPVIASLILIGVGLFLALTTSNLYREIAFSNVKVEVVQYSYIYCTTETEVDNSSWKIIFQVFNRGTEPVELIEVFVNGRIVDVYGLVHGDSLLSGELLGTSLPIDGYKLMNGEGLEIYLWIGDELFSSGTVVVINLNPINNVTLSKSIKLT